MSANVFNMPQIWILSRFALWTGKVQKSSNILPPPSFCPILPSQRGGELTGIDSNMVNHQNYAPMKKVDAEQQLPIYSLHSNSPYEWNQAPFSPH